MQWDSMSRRFFLKGAGASLLLPLLPSLSKEAYAAGTASRKRAIFLWQDAGIIESHWYPVALPNKVIGARVKEISLSGISGQLSTVFDRSWDPFRKKMLLVRGLDMYRKQESGHLSTPALACNYLSGNDRSRLYPSIDQVIAYAAATYASPPPVRSLQHRAGNDGCVTWRVVNGQLSAVSPVKTPSTTFDAMFKISTPTTGPADTSNARKKRVLDHVMEELRTLTRSSKLSSEDKNVLEEHVTFVNEVDQKLMDAPTQTVACGNLRRPTASFAPSERDQYLNEHIDVIALAIRCGYTNVASLMLMQRGGADDYTKSNAKNVSVPNFHSLTHSASLNEKLQAVEIVRYLGSKVTSLCAKLDVTEDSQSGKTFLDNSLVYWTTNHGTGEGTSFPHNYQDMAVVTVGSAGGAIKTDRYLDYRDAGIYSPYKSGYVADGIYNQYLVSLMLALGVTPSEWQFGGNKGFGDYGGFSYYAPLTDAQKAAGLPYLLG